MDCEPTELVVRTFEIVDDLSPFEVRVCVRELATRLGFDRVATGRAALVATELATNILKHGPTGTVSVSTRREADVGDVIAIEAKNVGVPFLEYERMLEDGHDAAGPIVPEALVGRRGLGTGLGAVVRLAGRLEYRHVDGVHVFEAICCGSDRGRTRNHAG